MRISMWILQDWLKKYSPKSGITKGEMVLQNIRLFSEDRKLSTNTAYLYETDDGRCMIVNGHDLISVDCGDSELILNEILDAFEFYNEVEERLEQAVQSEDGAAKLLDAAQTLFSENLLLADASFRVYAKPYSKDGAQDFSSSELPLEALLAVNKQQDIRVKGLPPYIVPIPNSDETVTVRNLFTSKGHMGWLIAIGTGAPMSRGRAQVFSEVGRYAETWIEEAAKTGSRLGRTAPFLEILSGSFTERESLEKSIKAMGWHEGDSKQLYYFQACPGASGSRDVLAPSLTHLNENAVYFYFEDNPLLICNYSLCQSSQLERELRKILKITGTSAGKSPIFTDIFTLPENYQAARIAVGHGASSEKDWGIYEFSDAVVQYAAYVLKTYSRIDISHPALSTLRQYDQKHDASLYQTLKCFLENECSFTDSAKTLNIHRSTLIYRLDRIAELTGVDTSNVNERTHLRLSFLLQSF